MLPFAWLWLSSQIHLVPPMSPASCSVRVRSWMLRRIFGQLLTLDVFEPSSRELVGPLERRSGFPEIRVVPLEVGISPRGARAGIRRGAGLSLQRCRHRSRQEKGRGQGASEDGDDRCGMCSSFR